MFQEFWLKPGEKASDPTVTGARKVLCNPYVSTAITVVLGIALGMTGYAKIWPLFGAANQLLAGLGLGPSPHGSARWAETTRCSTSR